MLHILTQNFNPGMFAVLIDREVWRRDSGLFVYKQKKPAPERWPYLLLFQLVNGWPAISET